MNFPNLFTLKQRIGLDNKYKVGIYKYLFFNIYFLIRRNIISLCIDDKFSKITGSRICGLSSYMQPEDFTGLEPGSEYRIMGCCMYNMYNVILGSYRQFLHLKGCYSWDILPGMNLALEQGLDVELAGKKYGGEFLYPGIKYRFKIKAG